MTATLQFCPGKIFCVFAEFIFVPRRNLGFINGDIFVFLWNTELCVALV